MHTDSSLIQAVLAGDHEAFAVLVRRYQRIVLAIAWKSLRDAHAIEDVAQQSFFTAYQKLGDLRDHSLFGPWLVRIVQRQAFRTCRDRQTDPGPLDADVAVIDPSASAADRSEQLLAAMARLPEHELIVVTLHYLEGHSVNSISEFTGRPVGTVTKQLSRAILRLKGTLSEPVK